MEDTTLSRGKKPAERINVAYLIERVADEVNTVLNKRKKERYFDNIVLLYSFIENLLKWLIYVKVLWEKCDRTELISGKEVGSIESFCEDLSFYNSIQIALLIDLVSLKLYRRIDRIRIDRNKFVHQLCIYTIRDDIRESRRKLEDLADVVNELVGICNKLSKEISPDLLWQMSLIGIRK